MHEAFAIMVSGLAGLAFGGAAATYRMMGTVAKELTVIHTEIAAIKTDVAWLKARRINEDRSTR